MTDESSADAVAAARADQLCTELDCKPTAALAEEGAALLPRLAGACDFVRMCELAERVCRLRPGDGRSRRAYAQGLIETRRLHLAVPYLQQALSDFASDPVLRAEFEGQIGRACKQQLVDGAWLDRAQAQRLFDDAWRHYAAPFDRAPQEHYWQGINLAALACAARRRGLDAPADTAEALSARTLDLLQAHAAPDNPWWHASCAEALLGLGRHSDAERALRSYLAHAKATAFMLAGTLRQFRELWEIQREPSGARLLQMLESQLLTRFPRRAVLQASGAHLVQMRDTEPADETALQSMGGQQGRATLEWYRAGLHCAGAVAAVRRRLGLRFGTGFAVRAGDMGGRPAAERLLLTNHHVLHAAGVGDGSALRGLEVVFEAADAQPVRCTVRDVVAESPSDGGLDYALLRLDGWTDAVPSVTLSCEARALEVGQRVYVIGHPLGNELQISLQDNVLTDHECGPGANPPVDARRRLQYSASTDEGSSGSPVFDDQWQCIALHHAGGRRDPGKGSVGIPALNRRNAYVDANQGIWIGSIVADLSRHGIALD